MVITHLSTKKWLKRTVTIMAAAAVITGLSTTAQSQEIASPTCSLDAGQNGILINFNTRLFANRGADQSQSSPVNVNIPAGEYQVTLQSFDGNHPQSGTQTDEQWHVHLHGANLPGNINTFDIGDLPDTDQHKTQMVNTSLILSHDATEAIARHILHPSDASYPINSIEAVCALFDPIEPEPSPSPKPSPTPNPAPEPENDDDDNGDDNSDPSYGLSVTKDDNQDVTRPGHTLTYTIRVENTGDGHIDDASITDTTPSGTTITSVSNGGDIEGRKITWSNIGISDGETIEYFVTVTVDKNVSDGRSLVNTVKARSENKGVSASDTDTTVVERVGQVTGITDDTRPVPVTAPTGATALGALLALTFGSLGLTYTKKSL